MDAFDDVFAVAAQEIVDGLDADPHRSGRLVLVQVLERKIRRVRFLDDALDHTINGRVVAALEVRDLHGHQVGMARGELGRPDLVIGAGGVAGLPYVSDIEWMLDHAGADFFSKQALQQVFVEWQRTLRKDRVAELLELVEDFVVQAGIVMIGTAEHHNADAVLTLELVEHVARLVPHASLVFVERLIAGLDGALVLFGRQAEQGLESGEHLVRQQLAVLQVENRIDVLHLVFGKDIALLGIRGFDRLGTRRHRGAGVRSGEIDERRVEDVHHGEEDQVERLLGGFDGEQIMDVSDADLCRETRIDGSAAGAGAIKLRTGVIGVNEILGFEAEAFEVRVEERRVDVGVQHPRDANAQIGPILHQGHAVSCRSGPGARGYRVGDERGLARTEGFVRGQVDEVRVILFRRVQPRLDVLHVVHLFDGALFAGGDNQALLAGLEGDFCLDNLADGDEVVLGSIAGTYVDKRAQAIVLAEVTACVFVASGAIGDVANRVQPDEAGTAAVAIEASGLDGGADCARLAAMLVHDNLRLAAAGAEAGANEVHFRFHDSHIVLRAALQHEARPKRSQIGNAGHVQEHVLWQHGGKTCQDLFRAPALALEVHNVRLHEDRAAVS